MNKTVVVKFETNGGNQISQVTIEYGFLINVPEPKKIGYEFACWCKDSSLKEEFDANKIIEENLTLYAKWNNYAPQKFIDDISVYTNLSNVVKDYQEIYDSNLKPELDSKESKDKKERARIDKSNYVKKLDEEFNVANEEYKIAALEYNKAIQETAKICEKKNSKLLRKKEEKCKKIIALYNEYLKKEEEAKTKYDSIVEKLDSINAKYEEFVSKNK